jgi:hypothetical protein
LLKIKGGKDPRRTRRSVTNAFPSPFYFFIYFLIATIHISGKFEMSYSFLVEMAD